MTVRDVTGRDQEVRSAHTGWISCAILLGVYGNGVGADEQAVVYGRVDVMRLRFPDLLWRVSTSPRWAVAWARPAWTGRKSATLGDAIGDVWLGVSESHDDGIEPARLAERFGRIGGGWSVVLLGGRDGAALARDAAGVQSLYYRASEKHLYFCSNLTCFNGLGWMLDRESVASFLHYLYIPAPRTIFQNVRSLRPGEIVTFHKDNGVTQAELGPIPEPVSRTSTRAAVHSDHVAELEWHLARSVRSCCVDGCRSALLLSGGKDSSALAVGAHLARVERLTAVTVGFSDSGIDETTDGRVVAAHLGLPFLSLRPPAAAYLRHWDDFVANLGQPMADPAAVPLFLAFAELKQRFDVCLDGTGNDSYFGITSTWQEDVAWRLHRIVPGLHRLPWRLTRTTGAFSLGGAVASKLRVPRQEQFVSWNGWTASEIRRLTGATTDWSDTPLYRAYVDCRSAMEHKTRTLGQIWEPETAFRKTVQQASLQGLRMAFPFRDAGLVAFVLGLPERERYRGQENKTILRQVLRRHLPPSILVKRKGSFVFPIGHILNLNGKDTIHGLLTRDIVKEHDLVDWEEVRPYLHRYVGGQPQLEVRMWALVILHSWARMERELRKGPLAPPSSAETP